MRSKKVEFRMSWPLYEKSLERCKDEKYQSYGRYLTALAIRDILVNDRKPFVALIAKAPPKKQDALLAAVLDHSIDDIAAAFCHTLLNIPK